MKEPFVIVCLLFAAACSGSGEPIEPLPHYDLSKPEKFSLPAALMEISGIAFSHHNDTLYGEQDEEGRLFYFRFGDPNISSSKFGRKGDYEDVAIDGENVVMLRSDGLLVSFPLAAAGAKNISGAREWADLLPPGEYEGMFADPRSGLLHVLCKHCEADRNEGTVSGYLFRLDETGVPKTAGKFSLRTNDIAALVGEKKLRFRPSALARSSKTGDWYILSSVNKMIVIADSHWSVKQVVRLNETLFRQPEGIAFDKQGNLYISNEGVAGTMGNILKFVYRP